MLAQLSFFKPDPKIIKRRIEALIDRDYLGETVQLFSNLTDKDLFAGIYRN